MTDKKRSRASIKGWKTRKKREREEERLRKKRAAAARKGWETRKAKAKAKERKPKGFSPKAKARAKEKAKPLRFPPKAKEKAKKRSRKPKPPRKPETPEVSYPDKDSVILGLQDAIRRLQETVAEQADQLQWVEAVSPEWRHDNGTIALQPSRLRHLPETPALLKILETADKKGVRALEKQAKELARLYEVSLKEVYTLFFSP